MQSLKNHLISPKLLIAVVPLIFAAVNVAYLSVIFPIFSAPPGYDQDPAYAYLFNGLLILDGLAPWHIDHPGTPLQFLCALIIPLARAVLGLSGQLQKSSLIDEVLSNSEPYLYAISIVLLLLNSIMLYYLGSRVQQCTKQKWLAIFCQWGGLAFAIVSPKAAYLAPEALLIFATNGLVAFLVPLIFTRAATETELEPKYIRASGIVCGLGLAAKLTFLPMVVLILLLPSLKAKIRATVYATGTFVVLLIPTYKNATRLFSWMWGIASHSGLHGSGDQQIFDWSKQWQNIRSLLSWFAPLYLVFFTLLGYAFFRLAVEVRRQSKANQTLRFANNLLYVFAISNVAAPVVLSIAILMQTLLVMKHPGAHYVVPALPLAFVGFAWLLDRLHSTLDDQTSRSVDVFRPMIVGCAILYALYSAYPTVKQLNVMRAQRHEQDLALEVVTDKLSQEPDALVICAFRCTLPQYATGLGLIYAPGLASRPIVKTLLANFYEYNFLVKKLVIPGYPSIDLEDLKPMLARNQIIYLVTPKDYPDLKVFKLEPISSTNALTLYAIKGLEID